MNKPIIGLRASSGDRIHITGITEINRISREDVAIIGMDVKLPMADNMHQFWENICNSMDCAREFPEGRKKDVVRYLQYKGLDTEKIKFKEAAYLDGISGFDYSFFGISPKEASLMSPQQRMFLETAFKAVEDSGYGNAKLKGSRTGVYLGVNCQVINKYQDYVCEIEPESVALSFIGNIPSVIGSRIAYYMDLKGPSMLIDTACSSSLVAVHTACNALKHGECDYAIAGGISISFVHLDGGMQIGIESSDGRTRTFDNNSNGTGSGEGVAAIVLKPYYKAIEDKDNIYAVIKGSAINQDGNTINIAAPNPDAQADVIKTAWANAKVDPKTISYIEAHGTGTRIGDPIEIEGITKAFNSFTQSVQFCAVGSVKSNIGHLDGASGIVGLIKAVLCLKNKKIAPTIYFNTPNEMINFMLSPVYVNKKLRNWNSEGVPRRCGVSSFGISGTNCHVVLEEHLDDRKYDGDEPSVLVLSAKSGEALRNLINEYIKETERNTQYRLLDICYTANTSRSRYRNRIAIIAENPADLAQKLKEIVKTPFDTMNIKGVFYGQDGSVGCHNAENAPYHKLTDLCERYVSGEAINWEQYFLEKNVRKISLPTYQFDKKRCWLDIPEVSNTGNEFCGDFLYEIGWKKIEPENEGKTEPDCTSVLIIKGESQICDDLVSYYKSNGINTLIVENGGEYKRIDEDRFIINFSESHFSKLFSAIKERNITDIIHLAAITDTQTITNMEQLEKSQDIGVYCLFNMIKALVASGYKQKINISLIAENVNQVTGRENRLNPQHNTLFGLGKVISREYVNISCRCFDIDAATELFELTIMLNNASKQYMNAFREGELYFEEFQKIDHKRMNRPVTELKTDGVYLITGGTGGMGIEFAKHLAASKSVNIALVNRSKIPERSEWEKIIKENKDHKLAKKLIGIKSIEALKSNVVYYCADIGNETDVENIINDLKNKFGNINGVIHTAGSGGYGFIYKEELHEIKEILKPKVEGTWLLDKLTQNEPVDFFVMCSSFTSVLGASGHGDYMAANSFLDSYAAYRSKKRKKTLTINWTRWRETGMAVDYGINEIDGILKSLQTREAINAFDQLMKSDIKRAIVGELNYELLSKEENKNEFKENLILSIDEAILSRIQGTSLEKKQCNNNMKGEHEEKKKESFEVRLAGRSSIEQYSDVERKIAFIWKQVLGFEELNIDDNFFEIGGNSVMLIRVHALLEKEFAGKVSITDLFAYTTIKTLAGFVSGEYEGLNNFENHEENFKENISQILGSVDNGEISIEEAVKKLESFEV